MTDKSSEKSPIADRLKHVAKLLGVEKPSEFSDFFSLSRQYGWEVITGKRGVGERLMQALADGNVNLNWLFTGLGKPLLAEGSASEAGEPIGKGPMHTEGNRERPLSGAVSITEMDVQVSAGDGRDAVVEVEKGSFQIDEIYFRNEIGIDRRFARIVRVVGDSMEPTFRSNDPVLVYVADGQPKVDGIWVIRQGHAVFVKRLQFMVDGTVRVLSDNPSYKEQVVDLKMEQPDFGLVGRVVWSPKIH